MANNITLPGTLGAAILRTITRIIGGQEVHSQAMFEVNPYSPTVGNITASGVSIVADTRDSNAVTVSVTGTYAGASFVFEASDDASMTNWFPITAIRSGEPTVESKTGLLTNVSRAWTINTAGFWALRVRSTAFSSGSASISISPTNNTVTQGVVPTDGRLQATTGILTTIGDVVEADMLDAKTVTFAISGTYTTANMAFEASYDRVTWYAMDAARSTGNSIESVTGNLTTTNRAWEASNGAFPYFRIRLTAIASGSVNVLIMPCTASYDPSPCIQTHGVTLQNSAALTDNYTNPTEGRAAADQFQFNGTTWDRQRNNWNTTTGDTGAKTASLNGATQTNYNASGAVILFNIGAVSGTNPTLNIKLQGSADGGTTWFDIPGAALPTITATGQFLMTVHPAITAVANSAVAFPLMRTWRAVYTIGGTTPSFTITNVQVAYVD